VSQRKFDRGFIKRLFWFTISLTKLQWLVNIVKPVVIPNMH